MFMLGKDDPRRKKSDEFFQFWQETIDKIQKEIPKADIVKKVKKGVQNAMMEEMKKKMAEKEAMKKQ